MGLDTTTSTLARRSPTESEGTAAGPFSAVLVQSAYVASVRAKDWENDHLYS